MLKSKFKTEGRLGMEKKKRLEKIEMLISTKGNWKLIITFTGEDFVTWKIKNMMNKQILFHGKLRTL